MVRKTVAVASVPPFSSQRLEGKISVARSPPPRPLTAVSFSNGQCSGGGADLGLERFIGTVHVSARGKVWRTVPTETSNGEVIVKNRQVTEP